MKRQLKFRAWDPHRGDRGIMLGNHTLYTIGITGLFNMDFLVWMQFTGLYDVDGKEIYEGDIVNLTDSDGENETVTRFVVMYSDRWAEFKLEGANSLSFFIQRYRNFKVIGNIYENPELL